MPQRLGVGATYECSFSASVTGDAGDRETDTVTATATDDQGNPAEASDSATVEITGEPVCRRAWLTIRKYHDLNGNGTRDENEPFLSGWVFRITADGQMFDIVTDETGTARLEGLRKDQTVTIEERLDLVPQDNWSSTTGVLIQTTLCCGNNEYWFGNAQIGPPPTGRGIDPIPDGGLPSPVAGAAMLAGAAVFLVLVTKVGRATALAAAGRAVLPLTERWLGWLLLPLVLLAIAIRRLTRRDR